MNYKHTLILYQNITPLHVGCGQAVGVVDLPVIRERSTGYPFIPGSGIRGSLRDVSNSKNKNTTKILFGPENDSLDDEKYAGCVAIHDARLLFYPARADKEVFLWITCPAVLHRFNRDIKAFDISSKDKFDATGANAIDDEHFFGSEALGNIHLEEFYLKYKTNNAAANLHTFAGQFSDHLDGSPTRVVLVSDHNFFHFVNYATMLIQHNTLTSAKTVKDGALFSIESVPPETIFYGMISSTRERKDYTNGKSKSEVATAFKSQIFGEKSSVCVHLGGKESIGHGLTKLTWLA